MWQFAVSYVSILVSLIVLDLVWLGLVMKDFYFGRLGHLLSPTVHWLPAVVFYLIFSFGVFYFAVNPGLAEKNFLKVIISAALLGFIAYATYDLTNMATMRDWPLSVTLVDILWGTLLSAATASIGFGVASALN